MVVKRQEERVMEVPKKANKKTQGKRQSESEQKWAEKET